MKEFNNDYTSFLNYIRGLPAAEYNIHVDIQRGKRWASGEYYGCTELMSVYRGSSAIARLKITGQTYDGDADVRAAPQEALESLVQKILETRVCIREGNVIVLGERVKIKT